MSSTLPRPWYPAPHDRRRPVHRRVVATAYGVCGGFGTSGDELARALGAEPATPEPDALHAVDDAALDVALAALVPPTELRRMDRLTKFGTYAGLACFRSSGVAVSDANRDRVGAIFACSFGPVASTREFVGSGLRGGIKSASPLLFPYTVYNACPGVVTILLGIRGVSSTVSGSNPVAYALDLLRAGRADALLAGGFEELTPEVVAALRHPSDEPDGAAPVGPLAEGAAVVMLEGRDHAASRGARVLFELRGHGQGFSFDDSGSIDNMRRIEPSAVERAMRAALDDARLTPEAIDVIVSLSRPDNGQAESEAAAVAAVWESAPSPSIRRPKHDLGDMLGGSDTLALIAAATYAAQTPARPACVLVNSYQLGGNVSSVVLEVP